MIVLGIDPGLSVSGWAIMSKQNNKQMLLAYGYLPLKSDHTLQERIAQFHSFFSEKIKTYGVTDISIETPFLGKNAQTFLKLGYLRGVLYLMAQQMQLKIHEFSPKEVKLAVTGFGAAQKDQVARMVQLLFPGMQTPKTYDVTDAVAVSLCGLWSV